VLRFFAIGGSALERSRATLGWWGGLTLIALRLVIGFHFTNEGLDKILHPHPFTAPFLENAVGPLRGWFHGMVWDKDGLLRLGYQRSEGMLPQVDMQPTRDAWRDFFARIVVHYNLDEQKWPELERVLKSYLRLLDAFVQEHKEEIQEYFQGVERRDAYRRDPNRMEVASLREQLARIESELRSKRQALLARIDALWAGLERDLNQVAAGQDNSRSPLRLVRLGRRWLDSETLNQVVPWFDLVVGLCLVTGALVRVAGLAGAVFLAAIVVSQWPGDPQAAPTWAQAIELAAMLHLVALGAGRWAGLDSLFARCCRSCCGRRQGQTS
jgi:uncharacterized membrane protein YphA (DoxX/SURF4 family)